MNRFLIRKIIYPLYRAVKRDSVLAHLKEMRQVQTMSADEIREYQWAKLQKLLQYSAKHVPYYRNLFKKIGASPQDFKSLDDFRSFPLIRKREINENRDALISEIYPRRWLTPDSTSGSTGENLYFFVDRNSSESRRANNVRMNEWIGIRIGDKTALLWGVPFGRSTYRTIVNNLISWFSNTIVLSAYRMDPETADFYIKKLLSFEPDLIIGYPSALAHFSEIVLKRSAKIKPKAVLVSGETLYDWQKEIIEAAFNAKVYNHYGCREFGAIARECKIRNGLHIASERLLVEVIQDQQEDDEVGELVITDLDCFGMPFIRYAIGDLGKITWNGCECGLGLPKLIGTIGRTFDVVRAPNGNCLGGTFWTILLRKMKGVERFQVLQEALDEITIAIVPTDGFSEEFRQYILNEIHKACGPEMKVRFEIKKNLDLTPAGKFRFVISKLPR